MVRTATMADIAVSWEPKAAQIILERMVDRTEQRQDRPFLLGVVGIPGSGKTTSCGILEQLLPNSIVLPMDGYHYSLQTLRQMDHPEDKVYRRGAPDTFDPHALTQDLLRIVHGEEPTVSIPGFDHAMGDPTPDQHTFVRGKHTIVICEGLYLLHDDVGGEDDIAEGTGRWAKIKDLLDYSIYIEADIDACIERLKERNKCIPGYTAQEIEIRCDVVDRRNAEIAVRSRRYANLSVQSAVATTGSVNKECDTF
jgi:pantothenate kinase